MKELTAFSHRLFFVIGSLCTPHSTLALGMTILYGNDAFSILVLSTKKNGTPVFQIRFWFSRNFVSKLRHWKLFKISNDCHIKTCRSLKRRAKLKSLLPFFRRTYALFVGFKIKPLKKKCFPVLRQKLT